MSISDSKDYNGVSLSAPWTTYAHELEMMLGDDPDISILYDEALREVKIYVDGEKKAKALAKLLNSKVTFGNCTLTVTVIFSNKEENKDILDFFHDAFEGNPVFVRTISAESPLGKHRFVMLKNAVAQFYNDQMDDPFGNKSMLYQEIAKDIFKKEFAVNFCTEPLVGTAEEENDDLSNG